MFIDVLQVEQNEVERSEVTATTDKTWSKKAEANYSSCGILSGYLAAKIIYIS